MAKIFNSANLSEVGKKSITRSTGVASLDIATGIGGWLSSTLVEIFGAESSGKTLIALLSAIEAQKRSKQKSLLIDGEYAWDPQDEDKVSHQVEWFRKLGGDPNMLDIYYPKYAEETYEDIKKIVEENNYAYIIIDSWKSMTPQSKVDRDMNTDKGYFDNAAKVNSEFISQLMPLLFRSDVTILVVNHLAFKIGVIFGCFSANSKVTLSSGDKVPIGNIVNRQIDCNVYCYDAKSKRVVESPVVALHKNVKRSFLHIMTESIGGSGRQGLYCTPDHMFITPIGDIPAKELNVGDLVYHRVKRELSSLQKQVIVGSLLGDGYINSAHRATSSFLEEHGMNQKEYLRFKADVLRNLVSKITEVKNKNKHAIGLATKSSHEFFEFRKLFYDAERVKRVPINIKELLTPLVLAIWYLDDGSFITEEDKTCANNTTYHSCIYSQGFSYEENILLQESLAEKFGITARVYEHKSKKKNGEYNSHLIFGRPATRKLHKLICNFVIPSMQYKLLPEFRGKYNFNIEDCIVASYQDIASVAVTVNEPVHKNFKLTNGYDLSVDKFENYFVSDILVHNSPETTPGGNALKFYAKQRVRVSPIKKIDASRGKVKGKFIKNKVAPPWAVFEFDLSFTNGVDVAASLYKLGIEAEIIDRSGSKYTVGDTVITGKDNFLEELRTDVILRGQVEAALLANYKPEFEVTHDED